MKTLSIIFVTHDSGPNEFLTNRIFIESLSLNTHSDFETIAIVRDKTKIGIYEDMCDKVIYVEDSLGHGYSFNRGAEISEGKYLAFCDNDIILSKDWDKVLIDELEKDLVAASPDSRMVQNYPKLQGDFTEFDKIYRAIDKDSTFEKHSSLYASCMLNFNEYVKNIPRNRKIGFDGDCLMVRRELFDNIKYDAKFLYGGGDWDYFLQIVSNGYPPPRIIYGVYAYHRPHERKYTSGFNNSLRKKWSNEQVFMLMPKEYSFPMINLNTAHEKNLPSVIYCAGVYTHQAKMIVDKGVDALKGSKMLKKFILPGAPIPTDMFPPVFPDGVEKCDIIHGHAGKCLEAFKRARELNKNTKLVLQCDSAHPNFTRAIMLEEYGILKTHGPWESIDVSPMMEELEMADRVILASRYEVDSYIRNGVPADKIALIPWTIDTWKIDYLPCDLETFAVYYNGGGDIIRKGLYYVREAVKSLVDSGLDVKYMESTGGDSYEIMREKLRHASVVISPALEDGHPAAMQEAMCYGRPVIVTPNMGTCDLVEDGDNGFVVPIRDVGAMMEKIRYYYDNRMEIIRHGRNARMKVLERTDDDYKTELIEFYKKLGPS